MGQGEVFAVSGGATLPLSHAVCRFDESFFLVGWECVGVERLTRICADLLYESRCCLFSYGVLEKIEGLDLNFLMGAVSWPEPSLGGVLSFECGFPF